MNYSEEESTSLASKKSEGEVNLHDDEENSNSQGRLTSDGIVLKTRGRCLKIGAWNVRTLYQPGKLDNPIQEMESINLDILGLAEIRWTDSGKIIKDSHTMI